MGGYAWIEVYRFKYELFLYNVKSVISNIRVDADAGSFEDVENILYYVMQSWTFESYLSRM
jgi:hypothetical protein